MKVHVPTLFFAITTALLAAAWMRSPGPTANAAAGDPPVPGTVPNIRKDDFSEMELAATPQGIVLFNRSNGELWTIETARNGPPKLVGSLFNNDFKNRRPPQSFAYGIQSAEIDEDWMRANGYKVTRGAATQPDLRPKAR